MQNIPESALGAQPRNANHAHLATESTLSSLNPTRSTIAAYKVNSVKDYACHYDKQTEQRATNAPFRRLSTCPGSCEVSLLHNTNAGHRTYGHATTASTASRPARLTCTRATIHTRPNPQTSPRTAQCLWSSVGRRERAKATQYLHRALMRMNHMRLSPLTPVDVKVQAQPDER